MEFGEPLDAMSSILYIFPVTIMLAIAAILVLANIVQNSIYFFKYRSANPQAQKREPYLSCIVSIIVHVVAQAATISLVLIIMKYSLLGAATAYAMLAVLPGSPVIPFLLVLNYTKKYRNKVAT